jgi:hypothetical protein
VFHDVPLTATTRTVPEQRILSVAHSRLRFQAPLRLVKLYTPDIGAAWQLKRTDLIDTPASDYPYTAPWALAIHEARADIHGLIWTSRRYDPQRSIVLWGDRVPASMLQAMPKQPADRGSSVYVQLHAVAAAYNIVITL